MPRARKVKDEDVDMERLSLEEDTSKKRKTRSTKKLKEESDSDASDSDSDVPKKKKQPKGKKPAKKEESDSDNDEDESNGVPNANHDSILKGVVTISRTHDGIWITFPKNKAQLRNTVQNICQNHPNHRGVYSSKVSFDDLFYARNIFEAMLSVDPVPNEEEEDTMEQAESIEEHVQNNIKKWQQNIRNTYGANVPAGLQQLHEWIVEESKARVKAATALIETGVTNFDGLSIAFKPGTKVIGKAADCGAAIIGYQVTSYTYASVQTMVGKVRWFTLNMEYIVSEGRNFLILQKASQLDHFTGTTSLEHLPYAPMIAKVEKMLADRGRRYVKLSVEPTFLSYDNDCFSIHQSSATMTNTANQALSTASTFLRTKGRVMVDSDTGRRLGHFPAQRDYYIIQCIQQHHQQKYQQQQQQQLYMNNYHHRRAANQYGGNYSELEIVPESMLCLCWPAVTGFSFTAKVWGHVLVDGLKEIDFDDKAFEQLVLAPDRKQLIHAMVKHSEGVFKDIISGKGGGSIFLLHGPPGVGKTLTAEAVAEMLHKPLYSVSMGELGVTPAELETKLKDILELASVWNALVLMDEADIFLERRGQKEIVRNAMVGVIMRLIEYYQGVLFLTSNRVESFDEAFYSRITVALKYEPLTEDVRESVWAMLAKGAGIHPIDVKKLGKHPLNGRQIKNCIVLAQGLAKADNTKVTMDHIDRTVKVCLEFVLEMENQPSLRDSGRIFTGFDVMTKQ